MIKRISATRAKNNFGGLLEDVAALGAVEVVKHGRVVAVVLSPQEMRSLSLAKFRAGTDARRSTHMIPPEHAAAARMLTRPSLFDED